VSTSLAELYEHVAIEAGRAQPPGDRQAHSRPTGSAP
jgi:hypothetical protein